MDIAAAVTFGGRQEVTSGAMRFNHDADCDIGLTGLNIATFDFAGEDKRVFIKVPNLEGWEKDQEVLSAYQWFVDFMGTEEWARRKAPIQKHMQEVHKPAKKSSRILISDTARISFREDEFAWYLYLADVYINNPLHYDYVQGATIIPVFKRLGRSIRSLESIIGCQERVEEIISKRRNDPDPGLFELLVAVAYAESGWDTVEFIPETSETKTPDLHIGGRGVEWFVECKRMSKWASYSFKERKKWLRMWAAFAKYLSTAGTPLLLDIVFHVELDCLPDDFLERELVSKLRLFARPGVLIDDSSWTVSTNLVDMRRIENIMARTDMKISSPLFIQTIAGRFDPSRGFTFIVMGEKSGWDDSYLSAIDFAAGAMWSCDAEDAVRKKARSIWRKLAEATEQLPDKKLCAVHIGVESHDGKCVERQRYKRMCDAIFKLKTHGKQLHWIYCHVFDPRSFPDKVWDFGETVHRFSTGMAAEPLKHEHLVVLDPYRLKGGNR